jgi:hypothetical protein
METNAWNLQMKLSTRPNRRGQAMQARFPQPWLSAAILALLV